MSASGSAGPGSSSQRRGRGWWRGRPYRGGRWRGGRGRGSFSSYGKGDGSGPSSKPTAGAPLVQATLTNSRYPAWHIYMPNEAFSEGSPSARLVSAFMDYFQTHLPHYNLEELDSSGSLPLDCTALLADTALSTAVPDLASMIRNQPEATLNQMALALHTVLSSSLAGEVEITSEGERESRGNGSTDSYLKVPRLHIRLHNFRPIISLKSIKAPQYGKCVTVQGTVVRVSNIKPLVTTMAFKCLLCQEIQAVALSDGKYQLPTKCPTSECRGRTFTPLRSSPLTQTIDWQTVRVQEISGDDRREAGRIPRTIECELTADLVDACVPGDMVTITAVVKATGSEEVGRGRNAKDKCMFLLYLHAISVSNSKASAADASHGLHMDFSTKDYYAIQEIQSDKNVFRLIVGSLCPTIYGHEMVKAGLVLGLFGGSQKFVDSKMLQAAANVTPRGVYVCGNTTTTSGLTVTLTKEGGGSGNYALEAGALVLADQVFCQEQPTVQSSITCKRGDENVSSAAPISYRKGDQSIIVCKSADPHLELVAGENTRGVVRRSDHNNRILGIWLKDIDSSVRMVSTGGNYDRRLDFVVEPGDPPTSCEMENAPIVPRDDQVQCTLNDEPFGENTIIYLSKECRQSSVVVCTMPYDANIGHFGPGDLSRLKTWSPIKKNSTHFIAILRMEDIPVNTTKDVSMEILDLNIVDTRPSPFTFTVVDQSTDLGGTTTMQMSTITPSDYTSTGTTSEEKEPSVSSDTSVAVGASVSGVAIFALIVVAVVVALIGGFVIHRRSKTNKAKGDPNSSTRRVV